MLRKMISSACILAAAIAVALPATAQATVYNYKPSAPMLPSTSENTHDGYVYRTRNAVNHPLNTTFRLRMWVSDATICSSGCQQDTESGNTMFYMEPIWPSWVGTISQCSNLALQTWTASCWTIQ